MCCAKPHTGAYVRSTMSTPRRYSCLGELFFFCGLGFLNCALLKGSVNCALLKVAVDKCWCQQQSGWDHHKAHINGFILWRGLHLPLPGSVGWCTGTTRCWDIWYPFWEAVVKLQVCMFTGENVDACDLWGALSSLSLNAVSGLRWPGSTKAALWIQGCFVLLC